MSALGFTAALLPNGFSSPEIHEMRASDSPQAGERYRQLLSIGPEMHQEGIRGWHFAAQKPIGFSIRSENEGLVAVALAMPVRLDRFAHALRGGAFHGVHLYYAAHSRHEGRGYALAASCMAMLHTQTTWAEYLEGAVLNLRPPSTLTVRRGPGEVIEALCPPCGPSPRSPAHDGGFAGIFGQGPHGSSTSWSSAMRQCIEHLDRFAKLKS